MVLKGINFDRSHVTPEDDAIIVDTLLRGRSGVLPMKTTDGLPPFYYDTAKSTSTTVALGVGLLAIQGYMIQATPNLFGASLTVDTTGLANVTKYLCATVDLNQQNTPTGTIGTASYAVTYKQCRFEFLDLNVMTAQYARLAQINLHQANNPLRVASLPLYKAQFGSAGSLPIMTRIDSSFIESGVSGNPDNGIAARSAACNIYLNKTNVNRLPLSGNYLQPSGTGTATTPLRHYLNPTLVQQDSRSAFTDLIVIQKDGLYRFDINGSLNNCGFNPPVTPNWQPYGRYFEINLRRNNDTDNLVEFGLPKTNPQNAWGATRLFGANTTGQSEMQINGSVTVALFRGDSLSLAFNTETPNNTLASNPSAINITSKTGTAGTHLRNFSYSMERIGDLNSEQYGTSGAF